MWNAQVRISELYNLGRSQGALDFVDVDTAADVPVFIDPRAARRQQGALGEACRDLLGSYFAEVLEALNNDDRTRLYHLLALGEPNETHLGWSQGSRSRGRGVREGTADEIVEVLRESSAAREGLLHNLEDAMLLVPNIGPDLVSDISTHVLRGALVGYTQSWCEFLGIPMSKQHAGRIWHPNNLEWDQIDAMLPRTEYGPLVLVPRSIVRYHVSTDTERFYNGYLAPLLENREIARNTDLVQQYQNGRQYVPRPDLHERYPKDKAAIVEHSIELPDALTRYRDSETVDKKYPPLDHEDFNERTSAPLPDFIGLFESVTAISPGSAGAHSFHLNVEALLTAVFYPSLGNAKVELEIHEGRKRIDISYDNIALVGFFRWLSLHHPSASIPVECKNYSRDPGNEALDQLAGRFSEQRGKVGILVAREFADKQRFLERCRDTARDGRGWILLLDDRDLRSLAEEAERTKFLGREEQAEFGLLRDRFQYLVG